MSRIFYYDPERDAVIERLGAGGVELRRRPAWPRECYASGVHASQAQELRDFFAKNGESVEVTKNGDPVYTSASEERRCLRLRGMHNKKDPNC